MFPRQCRHSGAGAASKGWSTTSGASSPLARAKRSAGVTDREASLSASFDDIRFHVHSSFRSSMSPRGVTQKGCWGLNTEALKTGYTFGGVALSPPFTVSVCILLQHVIHASVLRLERGTFLAEFWESPIRSLVVSAPTDGCKFAAVSALTYSLRVPHVNNNLSS